MSKQDGPYIIVTQRSPITYAVGSLESPHETLGSYHVSALKLCSDTSSKSVVPLRKLGRAKRELNSDPGSSSGRMFRNQRGEDVADVIILQRALPSL
ncbi:hypothetical protein AVEN_211566-1 [Araneus ventricosus]|uniref:Uncharacterized protein n=1 Tax=Araneus ventricosus TaxID=182803 RepID=A0A4Y2D6S3_ARAVE|nr:hypothetical protein AVEN_211566-1 [Araneus ventricosus]